jgi:hypothetical protein
VIVPYMKDFPFVYPDEYDGKVHNFMGEKLKFTDGKIWNDKVEVIFRGGKLIKSKGPKKNSRCINQLCIIKREIRFYVIDNLYIKLDQIYQY